MSANDERIFPLLDRNAPIIDRLRERREQMRNSSGARSLGHRVARSALTGENIDEDFLIDLRADIAEELDIPEDQISGMYLSQLRKALSPALEDLIVQQQGISQDNSGTEEQESNEEQENNNEETQQLEQVDESQNDEDSGPVFPEQSIDIDEKSDEEEDADRVF